MKTLNHTNFQSDGEIKTRQTALFNRLHDDIYMPHYVFTADQNGWPGDWEGRTILALVSLAKVLKEEPKYLDGIIENLKDHLNEKGYLGHVLPKGTADEQQLSGHSWLLRGLCEYYRYKKDESVLETIKGIVKNLFLPLRKNYETYPILPEQRVYEGHESGSVAGMVNNWYISTDTGCAFIPLDGISDAYELMLDVDKDLARELRYMLGFMIDKFMTIPFTEICVQTHATLTGLRGMMRMFKHMRNHVYLSFVKDTFDLYINEGMTANFANYNWFGRPEWTEPCAIIDSFILACQLYKETAEQRYADYANYILYNGIYRSQRENGGFGTDNCAGPEDDYVIPTNYEAYWCCTMRGGEGLFAVSQYSLLERGKDIVMIYPVSGIYQVKGITMHIRTDYPKSGNISITIFENNSDKNVTMEFMMFRTYVDVKFLYNFKQRKIIITKDKNEYLIDFKLPIYYKLAEGKHNKKDKKLLMRGPAILGSLSPVSVPNELSNIVVEEFIPLYDTSFTRPRNRVEKDKIYILFDGQ